MGDKGYIHQYGGHYAGGFPVLGMGHGYPPVNILPVKPMTADTYSGQFPISVAIRKGTLFKLLYDPYHNPYEDWDSSSSKKTYVKQTAGRVVRRFFIFSNK